MNLTLTYNLSSIDEAAQTIAEKLLSEAHSNIVIFEGSMGMGKTTIIKKIVQKMGLKDEVTSPTFSLVNKYQHFDADFKSRAYNSSIELRPIYHFDFYRIKNIDEAMDIGAEEYFYSEDWCFIEWWKNVEPILPPNLIKITISSVYNTDNTLQKDARLIHVQEVN